MPASNASPDPATTLARDPDALGARLREVSPEAAARPGDVRVVHAPGRVNLIGEHTDYNEGFVLPVAIDLGIAIALVPTDDRRVEVTLAATGEMLGFDLDEIGIKRGTWIDYVAGTAWALAERGAETRGLARESSPRTCRRAPGCHRPRPWSWRRRLRSRVGSCRPWTA